MIADEVIVAILALIGTFVGSFSASKLVTYRIDQLEKKVEKHNDVVERFAILEHDETTQWKRIDELRTDIQSLKEEIRHV